MDILILNMGGQKNMNLYLDTANVDEIREAVKWGVICGGNN